MKRFLILGSIAVAAIIVQQTLATRSAPGPTYATGETRQVVERMIEAHGGMERWQNAPTISYDNTFFNPYAGAGNDPWWYSREFIEQGSRRTYQDWSADEATLAFDGKIVWSTNWTRGNPPAFQAHFFYYFLNLPWLTQDEGVVLGPIERQQLPDSDLEFLAIDMTFESASSRVKSGLDSYRLFIHPETWLLQAYQYSSGYAAILDAFRVPEGQVFGPMYRWHDTFLTVDGLTFPSRMHTMPPDASETYGYHLVTNYRLDVPFDEEWMMRPADAVVDESRRDR